MLYLVRHGESTWNRDRRSQGQTSHPPLTPTGAQQARRAARAIADDVAATPLVIARLVSSDLVRARQTAEPIAAALGLGVEIDERLREQGLGRVEGLDHDEAYALTADHDWADPDARVAGGESSRQVYDRVAAALTALADTSAVVVSHGDALRVALGRLAGHRVEDIPWTVVRPGEVLRVDGHEVRSLTHLSAEPAPPV